MEGTITIADLTTIRSIDEAIRNIHEAVVKRVGSRLDPPTGDEKVIGIIQDMTVKKLHCAAMPMRAEAASLMARSSNVLDEGEETILIDQSRRLVKTVELMKILFWGPSPKRNELLGRKCLSA